jgi:preprotein translocase subunit SecA
LHQAIEAKEGVKVQKENRTLATITFQNYFRMYEKLSGMTGTALTEEEEFREIYQLDVVEIPTNKPMIRNDRADSVYKNKKGKYDAIVRQIQECHEKGQPVLVGTITIDKSEELSAKLKRNGIPHNVLNAKYHEREAEIVAQAGRLGAVTISTNMAGRGTDIMLGGNPEYMAKAEMRKMEISEELIAMATGTAPIDDENIIEARRIYAELYAKYKEKIAPEAEKVRKAGGLFILGTERHESRRIDNQLRGRSGRQGDPGESRFFLSLEDDLMRLFGSDRMIGIVDRLGMEDDTPIDAKILSNQIQNAQKRIEDMNFKRRKNVLTYDDVMNQQRTIIYKQRQNVLDGENITETIQNMIKDTLIATVDSFTNAENHADWDLDGLRNKYLGLICNEDDFRYSEDELASISADDIIDELADRALKLYHDKEELFGEEIFREVERSVLLRNVDKQRMEHIDAMDDLKEEIGLQAYAQRNPVNEYRIIGADMFDAMVEEIREGTVRTILSVFPRSAVQRVQLTKQTVAGLAGENPHKKIVRRPAQPQKPKGVTVVGTKKPGRNDPCPCGSGKKYKNCCGANPGKEQ